MRIETVRGAINPNELGFTSMHEHVLRGPDWPYKAIYKKLLGNVPANRFPVPSDKPISIEDLSYLRHSHHELSDANEMDEPLMIGELSDFCDVGGKTVLECGAPGIRGDLPAMQRVSEQSGANIVVSTGLYVQQSWPDRFRDMSVEDFTAYMEDEIENGIDGTGIKPGQIKTAINGPITEGFDRFVNATAGVARNSGMCVTAHVEECTQEENRETLDAYAHHGMPMEKVIVCHFQTHFQELDLETLVRDPSRFALHMDYALEVLDRGVTLCIDCFGIVYDDEPLGGIAESDAYKIAGIIQLLERGYEDQIVVGTDIFMRLMTRRYGGHGYVRLNNYVVPTLKSLGVSEAAIEKMTVKSPARLLAF
jgi:phosphotriesterase-related protein